MAVQARTEFAAALNQLASEKGVDVSVVVDAIEQAALAAYRKDLSLRNEEIPEDFEELTASIDPVTGEISILRGKENITPPGFARIAAQTAKQVIMQRLYEAEKGAITDEYEKKVGTVISGVIQRQEGNTYFVDLGRAEGVLPPSEQTRDEYYHSGQRLKFYIKEIREGKRGVEVIVSRSDANLVKGLFTLEVPELQTGSVVIKDVVREAGSRTKIAAISVQEGVDPVGSLVGQKGVRVQAVINELGEERVDVIPFSEDPARYIASALSPAKDVKVTLEEKEGTASPDEAGASRGGEKRAKVVIASSQLSLAIGKGGQNVRLAARLTGWKIDIEGAGEPVGTGEVKEAVSQAPVQAVVEEVEKKIDEATAEEAVNGNAVTEPTAEEAKDAVGVAEADIAEDDAKSGETEAEKLAEDKGSIDEDTDKERGDIIATRQPSEEEAPTVANTSETPGVSDVEPAFEEKIGEPEEKKSE